MLTQWHLPPPLTSTVKSSLFTHAHSSPLSLAARLHQCHANHSRYINNGCTFSAQTLYVHTKTQITNLDGQLTHVAEGALLMLETKDAQSTGWWVWSCTLESLTMRYEQHSSLSGAAKPKSYKERLYCKTKVWCPQEATSKLSGIQVSPSQWLPEYGKPTVGSRWAT